jgi:hypothetical protein
MEQSTPWNPGKQLQKPEEPFKHIPCPLQKFGQVDIVALTKLDCGILVAHRRIDTKQLAIINVEMY